ncbi:hypothetical protein DL767_005687 [Monosporascus sp. MG133]|nr:hypothetical protein DL767_005687 [Monosporascus sp. MG133]
MSIDSVVALMSARANSSSGVDELAAGFPVSAGIFIGSEGLELPVELAFNMWVIACAEYWSEKNTATVPYSMKDSEVSFTKVVVPLRNLVSALSGFGDTCAFLVKSQSNP